MEKQQNEIAEYLMLSQLGEEELIKMILSKNQHIEDLYNENDKLIDQIAELEAKLKT
jgi:hypothetical protein